MKQAEFESIHRDFWAEFAQKIQTIKEGEVNLLTDFPNEYRKICQHLAIAKSRGYAITRVNALNKLVEQGYQLLYGNQIGKKSALFTFLFGGFQDALRENSRFIYIAATLFVLPLLVSVIACLLNDEFVYSIMSPEQVRSFESMYDPELRKLGRERQSDSDLLMFGFYIKNNIGIAFTMFATGIFLCLGSIFALIFNGVHIGAAAGHISSVGYTDTFFPFVAGHGSFELTALVFAGAAGLKIGYALLAPGSRSRLNSLQVASIGAIKIVYGAGLMLLIAAFIEAFWSSSSNLSNEIKYSVGAALWILVFYYCFFLGRMRYAT